MTGHDQGTMGFPKDKPWETNVGWRGEMGMMSGVYPLFPASPGPDYQSLLTTASTIPTPTLP